MKYLQILYIVSRDPIKLSSFLEQMMKSLKRKTAMSVRIRRRNEFLAFLVAKFHVKCFFCGKEISPRHFYEWRDDYTLHHKNEIRGQSLILDIESACDNLEICHKSCHRKHHKQNPSPKLESKTIEVSFTGDSK